MSKAVVTLSGGIDSALCMALAQQSGHDVFAMHYMYGQRTWARELACFGKLCDYYQVRPAKRLVVNSNFFASIGGSALTDKDIAVPKGEAHPTAVPVTYVPFRNAHILSHAVSWAEVLGAERVYMGSTADDSAPDSKKKFYQEFSQAVAHGTKAGFKKVTLHGEGDPYEPAIKLVTPLVHYDKVDVVSMALRLGVPLQLTWSCYEREGLLACGGCKPCLQRLESFKRLGATDPILYDAA